MQCQLDAKTRSSFRRCDGWAMSHSQHIFAPSFFLKKTVTVTCFFRLLIDCTVPSTTIYVRPSRRIVGIFFYVEHSVANDEHEPKHCSRHVINKEYTDPLKRYIERILFHLGPLMVGLFEAMHLYMKAIPKFGPSFWLFFLLLDQFLNWNSLDFVFFTLIYIKHGSTRIGDTPSNSEAVRTSCYIGAIVLPGSVVPRSTHAQAQHKHFFKKWKRQK